MIDIVEAIRDVFGAIIMFAFGFVVGAILMAVAWHKEKGK